MKEKLMTALIALTAVFLLGHGFTGFYLMDFTQTTCLANSDCDATCCPVYGEEYGLCDSASNCDSIYQATKEVSSEHSTLSPTEMKVEARATSLEKNYVAVALGIFLAAIVLIVAYLERKHKPKAIIAIACERDLVAGIKDVPYKILVHGIPNLRPNGPCKDTIINTIEFEKSIRMFLGLNPKPISQQ